MWYDMFSDSAQNEVTLDDLALIIAMATLELIQYIKCLSSWQQVQACRVQMFLFHLSRSSPPLLHSSNKALC